MEENRIICSHCGAVIDDDDYEEVNGQVVCSDCISRYTTTCERCGAIIWDSDVFGDDYTNLCSHCYHNYYSRCAECDALIRNDDAYEYEGELCLLSETQKTFLHRYILNSGVSTFCSVIENFHT